MLKANALRQLGNHECHLLHSTKEDICIDCEFRNEGAHSLSFELARVRPD